MTRSHNLRTARTLVYILLALTTIAAVAYFIFNAISLSNTSPMPWLASLNLTALYFLPFIVPEIACCVIFSIFYNKRAKAEKEAQTQ